MYTHVKVMSKICEITCSFCIMTKDIVSVSDVDKYNKTKYNKNKYPASSID